MANKVRVTVNYLPTTYGRGPYHPAIRDMVTHKVYYWPNISMDNEMDALQRAKLSLLDANIEAAKVIHQWNIISPRDV